MTIACYRDPDNGVYYRRKTHRHDCTDTDCRGCTPCAEAHCTATRKCAWHPAAGEITCGRCINQVRRNLRWITALGALMETGAESDGIDSEAANLAGPGADPRILTARRVLLKRHITELLPPTHWQRAYAALVPEDDDRHPYNVTTRWHMMLAEDYGHDLPDRMTTSAAVAYLDRNLHRIANDDEQDFPLLAREIRKCRQHMEAALHNGRQPEQGAPCRSCVDVEGKAAPRLRLERGHWCDDPECERLHYDQTYDADAETWVPDTSGDRWVCPRNRDHWWSQADYERWVYADARAASA